GGGEGGVGGEGGGCGGEVTGEMEGEYPQLIRRNPKRRSELMLLADGAAAPGIERVSSRCRVVVRQSGPRFDRYRGHAADAEIRLDHMVGGGERTIGCDCIAEHRAHEHIVRDLVPHWRSPARQRQL